MIHTVPSRRALRRRPASLRALSELSAAAPAWVVTHLVPSVIAMIVALRWFEPGTFIAAGDVTPFIRSNVSDELWSVWNHQLNGSGSTSSEIVRLVEVSLIAVVTTLGGSEILAQQLLYIASFGFAAFGAAHVARVVVDHRAAVAVAGLLGAFNPLVLHQMPNPIFMVAIGAAGVVLGELLGHLAGRPTSVVRLVVATLPYAYLATNPALLAFTAASFAAAVVIASRHARPGTMTTLGRHALFAVPWAVALHAWWLVPTFLVTSGGIEGATIDVVTDVDQWAWSHQENSLTNLVTFTAHWGWNVDNIFPWAAGLDRFPGSVTRWILPLGAIAAPVVARQRVRRVAGTMVVLLAVAIVLSKGLHPPLVGLNRFLYENVPGWWLMREPVSKVGPLQVLVVTTLFALTVERLLEATPIVVGRVGRLVPIGPAVAFGLTIGAVTFPWPLLSGSVIADGRGPLQDMHVAVPDEWRTIADVVNDSPVEGKVLVLPANDYYQVTTTWGYHGADNVPQQLLDRPMIQRYPGGYFDLSQGSGALLERIEFELVDGDPVVARNLIDALGVSHVIHRLDVVPGAVNARLPDNETLAAGLAATPGLAPRLTSDLAVVYELDRAAPVASVEVRTLTTRGDANDVAQAVGRLGPGEVLLDDAADADGLVWMSESGSDVFPFRTTESAAYRVVPAPGPRTLRPSARPVDDPDGPWEVTLADRSELDLNGTPLPGAASATTVLPSPPLAVRAGGHLDVYETDLGVTVELDHAVEILHGAGTVATGFGPLGDCNNRAPQFNEILVLSVVRTADGGLRLGANDHSACVAADVPTTGGPTLISLDYRTGDEDSGRLCIWDVTDQVCLHDERLEHSPPWQTVRAAVDLDAEHRYQVFVYAVADDGRPVEVEYRNLGITTLQSTPMLLEPEPEVTVELEAGSHLITAGQPALASLLGPFGDLADCHRLDARSMEEAGLTMVRSGNDVALGANVHSACTRSELDVVSGRTYEISFDHRSSTELPGRICLWMVGLDRCIETPALVTGDGWQRYHTEFVLPTAAQGADLFLYADGGIDPDRIEVEYRDIEVVPSPRRYVEIERTSAPTRIAPDVDVVSTGPASHELSIDGADGPFVVRMSESAATGWTLDGLPAGWVAVPHRADGFASAWLIDGEGDAAITLRYGPNQAANRAQQISLVAVVLALLGLFRTGIGGRPTPLTAPGPRPSSPSSRQRRPQRERLRRITAGGRSGSAR